MVHRLASGIHLPMAGANLLLVARNSFGSVIYIIIAAKMKTLHNSNVIDTRGWVRLVLAFVGVVAAIICLFTLLSDVHATANLSAPQLFETTQIVPSDFAFKISNSAVVSSIWPF